MEEKDLLPEQIEGTREDTENVSSIHVEEDGCNLQRTNSFLSTLFDIPLYHTSTWDDEDFMKICQIIKMSLAGTIAVLNSLLSFAGS